MVRWIKRLIWGRYVEYLCADGAPPKYGEVIDRIFCSGCFESGHYLYLVRFENGSEIPIGVEDTQLKKL